MLQYGCCSIGDAGHLLHYMGCSAGVAVPVVQCRDCITRVAMQGYTKIAVFFQQFLDVVYVQAACKFYLMRQECPCIFVCCTCNMHTCNWLHLAHGLIGTTHFDFRIGTSIG